MGSVVWTGPFCLPTMMTHRETVEMFKTRNRAPHRPTAPQSLARSLYSPLASSQDIHPSVLPCTLALFVLPAASLPRALSSFFLRLISSPTLFLHLRLIAATDATPATSGSFLARSDFNLFPALQCDICTFFSLFFRTRCSHPRSLPASSSHSAAAEDDRSPASLGVSVSVGTWRFDRREGRNEGEEWPTNDVFV